MPQELKVYCTPTMCPPELCDELEVGNVRMARAVVAAKSKQAAVKIFGRSWAYVSITTRAESVKAAMQQPGTVYYANLDRPTIYLPAPGAPA